MTKIKVNDVSINLETLLEFDNIDQIKNLNLFQTKVDASNQALWEELQDFKSKPPVPEKVEVIKAKKQKVS